MYTTTLSKPSHHVAIIYESFLKQLSENENNVLLIHEGSIEATDEPYQSFVCFNSRYGWIRFSKRISGSYFGFCLWGKELLQHYLYENIRNHPERIPFTNKSLINDIRPFLEKYEAILEQIKAGKKGYRIHKGLVMVYSQGNFYNIAFNEDKNSSVYGTITKLFRVHNPFDFILRHIVEQRVEQFVLDISSSVLQELYKRLNMEYDSEKLFTDLIQEKAVLIGGSTLSEPSWMIFCQNHSFYIQLEGEKKATDAESVKRIIADHRFTSVNYR